MADQLMLARRQIRLAALAALQPAATAAAASLASPGDWTTPPDILPAIKLRTVGDQKLSIIKGAPEFTTTVHLEIEAAVEANDEASAQDAIEILGYALEQALLTNSAFIGITNQFPTISTVQEITADGQRHVGGLKMRLEVEVPEMFDPATPPNFEGLNVHLDMLAPFDASGTYPSPAFPAAVTPAPRTIGPDGRDEGALTIDLPTS